MWLFPDFFQILQFWGMSQEIFRKLFPKSMILNEIWNFVNSGNDPGEFLDFF